MMNVFIKPEKSHINNDDIKWYLADESLWITKYEDYADIEKSIENSYGSFNWLYEVNDTLLFEKGGGRFSLAIIGLSRKISVLENLVERKVQEKEGDLYFAEKEHCNFEFDDAIYYVCEEDYLYSCLEKSMLDKETIELSITSDFHFFICDNVLVGWGLKNASGHLQASNSSSKVSNEHSKEWLVMYLRALKLWEKDETKIDSLADLFEKIHKHSDVISLAIKECLDNILSF